METHGVDSPHDGGRKGSAFLLALDPIHLIADAAEDRHALEIKGFLERSTRCGAGSSYRRSPWNQSAPGGRIPLQRDPFVWGHPRLERPVNESY